MKNILISTSILIFYILFGVFISGKHDWILFATLAFSYIIGYLIFNADGFNRNRKTFFLFVFPICILFLGTSIFQDNSFVRGFPYILLIPLISFAAIYFKQKRAKWAFFIIIPFCGFVGLIGFPNWMSFYLNQNSHVNKKCPPLHLINNEGNAVQLPNDKILILDFWSKGCAVCFKKFPAFEKIYLKYKNNPRVKFYAINIPVGKSNFSEMKKVMNDLDYKFETLYSLDHDSIVAEKMNFQGYPQLFILKNKNIRYQGSLITEKYIVVHNLENEIKRLLD